MSEKLTEAQIRVLKVLADAGGTYYVGHTVYNLGRNTCEALRKRGFVTTGHSVPISPYSNPHVDITDAGRAVVVLSKQGSPK